MEEKKESEMPEYYVELSEDPQEIVVKEEMETEEEMRKKKKEEEDEEMMGEDAFRKELVKRGYPYPYPYPEADKKKKKKVVPIYRREYPYPTAKFDEIVKELEAMKKQMSEMNEKIVTFQAQTVKVPEPATVPIEQPKVEEPKPAEATKPEEAEIPDRKVKEEKFSGSEMSFAEAICMAKKGGAL